MENNDEVNIIYFGQDIKTFWVLENDKQIQVKGVAKIGDFLKYKTFNPINGIFKFIYFCHYKEKNKLLKKKLNIVFQFLKKFSSGLFKKYSLYLNHIVIHDIKIIEYKNLPKLVKFVNENKVVVFLVNSWRILPEEIIQLPKFGCINIHPSKLPKYRGALPTLWALKNGDKTSAITYMVLGNIVDGGKIIAQHEFPIFPEDTAISVNHKIDHIISLTLPKDIISYVRDHKKAVPQYDEESSKTAKFHSYRKIIFREEKGIDIYNKINFYPYQYPSAKCYASAQGRKISFLGCRGIVESPFLYPGSYNIHRFHLFIGCKDYSIKLRLFRDINIINSCLIYLKLIHF